MSVWVLGVGRFAGRAHRDEGEGARRQVEEGVRRLAEDAQAAGKNADHELGQNQCHADADGAESDELGSALQPVHGFTLSSDFAAAGRRLPQQ